MVDYRKLWNFDFFKNYGKMPNQVFEQIIPLQHWFTIEKLCKYGTKYGTLEKLWYYEKNYGSLKKTVILYRKLWNLVTLLTQVT